MSGVRGRSGGSNKVSVPQHILRGTLQPSRHALALQQWQEDQQRASAPVAAADRRRLLARLKGEARRLALRLLEAYEWDAPGLVLLRAYVLSCARLEALQASAPDDTRALHREIRHNVLLLKSMDLERAS